MRAEDAAVGVRLVDDDPAEVREEIAPALVVGQDPDVEHVGVGEDQVRAAADLRPVVARRVAVVDRVAKRAEAELRELASLVLRQRLGRVEVERSAAVVARELVEHREVEAKRLARRGPAGDDDVALARGLERLELVRVERPRCRCPGGPRSAPGRFSRVSRPSRPARAGSRALGDETSVGRGRARSRAPSPRRPWR